jgi:large subunit ribosomal protein L10
MPHPQKIDAVKELKERLIEADAALLTEFRGLKVEEMRELRRKLAEGGSQFQVVKNTLARIAVQEASLAELLPLIEGSTAIAFVKGDPVAAARNLDEISRKFPALVIKGGLVEGRVLDAERARALARVKPREVLLADMAGLLQAPLQKLAFLVAAPLRELAYVLAAHRAMLEAQAPAAAAVAEEAPSLETKSQAESEPAKEEGESEEAKEESETEEAKEESETEEAKEEGETEEPKEG